MKYITLIVACLMVSCATYQPQQLADAYLEMPQLLFEDLCIDYPKWTEKQMAVYYLDHKRELDEYYAGEPKVAYYNQ